MKIQTRRAWPPCQKLPGQHALPTTPLEGHPAPRLFDSLAPAGVLAAAWVAVRYRSAADCGDFDKPVKRAFRALAPAAHTELTCDSGQLVLTLKSDAPNRMLAMADETFDVETLAAYLHLDPRRSHDSPSGESCPGEVGGNWRFNPVEVHHWLEDRIGLSNDVELQHMENALSFPKGRMRKKSFR